MKDRLATRLKELEAEYQKGQEQLQKLETEAAAVRNTMLRISGAIQVLKEELALSEQEDPADFSAVGGRAEEVKSEN